MTDYMMILNICGDYFYFYHKITIGFTV